MKRVRRNRPMATLNGRPFRFFELTQTQEPIELHYGGLFGGQPEDIVLVGPMNTTGEFFFKAQYGILVTRAEGCLVKRTKRPSGRLLLEVTGMEVGQEVIDVR